MWPQAPGPGDRSSHGHSRWSVGSLCWWSQCVAPLIQHYEMHHSFIYNCGEIHTGLRLTVLATGQWYQVHAQHCASIILICPQSPFHLENLKLSPLDMPPSPIPSPWPPLLSASMDLTAPGTSYR